MSNVYILNLIDTPGHVDFTYEVSRSLAACEGAVLLVDAAQGIEAQTLANLYLAMENDLEIIPVLNKIDLPAAQPEKYAAELAHIIGCDPSEVLKVSAKTGEGVSELLERIVEKVRPTVGSGGGDGKAGVAGFFQQLIHLSPRFFHRAQKQKPVGSLFHAPGGAAGNAAPGFDERLQVGGSRAHLAQHASLRLATLSGARSLGSSPGHFL